MQKTRHSRFFEILEALALAQEKVYRARVSALLVVNNTIVGYGQNSTKSDPMQKRYSNVPEAIHSHAEISCIKNSLRKVSVDDLKKATMYVLRMKKDQEGQFIRANAKPCEKSCQRAISQFELRRVFYTTEDGIKEL